MAEKEERIAIIKWNTKDSICPAPTELQCGGAKSCEECKVGISRQEAIERMAKALYADQYGKNRPLWEDEDNGYKEIYLRRAEAALNALLEGK